MMHYDCSDEMMNGDTKLCTLDALNLFANLTNYWRRTCVEIGFGKQGHSDGGYVGIYTPKSVYLKFFYVVVLSP